MARWLGSRFQGIIQMARWLVSRFQGILFKWLVGSSVDSKVYYSNGSLAHQSIPRYVIQMARRLASRFQGILFKPLIGSPVDSLDPLEKFL